MEEVWFSARRRKGKETWLSDPVVELPVYWQGSHVYTNECLAYNKYRSPVHEFKRKPLVGCVFLIRRLWFCDSSGNKDMFWNISDKATLHSVLSHVVLTAWGKKKDCLLLCLGFFLQFWDGLLYTEKTLIPSYVVVNLLKWVSVMKVPSHICSLPEWHICHYKSCTVRWQKKTNI